MLKPIMNNEKYIFVYEINEEEVLWSFSSFIPWN